VNELLFVSVQWVMQRLQSLSDVHVAKQKNFTFVSRGRKYYYYAWVYVGYGRSWWAGGGGKTPRQSLPGTFSKNTQHQIISHSS